MTRRGPLLRNRSVALVTLSVLLATAAVGIALGHWLRPAPLVPPDACTLTALGRSVTLEPEQTANAAVIAAVGIRRGLPAHAVTVALATALQESKLRNLRYGDRDSLGLFQQRPSQGWGTPDQILDPRYAAGRFYARLSVIPSWAELPIAEAAQRVQHSADGSAYAGWEDQARSMATALTGLAGAAVACTIRPLSGDPAALSRAILTDFGAGAAEHPTADPVQGWSLAGWLVAHARVYRLAQVSYLGRTWSTSTGKWVAGGTADRRVRYRVAPVPQTG